MKFLADENTDAILVAILREQGLDVIDIKEVAPGIDDREVLNRANEARAILITEDKDFGELVYRLKMITHGVILIRLSGWESSRKGRYVAKIIAQYQEELWEAFSVIAPDKVRVRKIIG